MTIGRISIPEARYFITICSKNRHPGLTNHLVSKSIADTWRAMHASNDFILHCATIMPDHVHFLITLGSQLTLSKLIVKFKTLTRKTLADNALEWQRNFYDHRLRIDTAMESFAKYVYMNPYNKGLIGINHNYSHWYLNKNYIPDFTKHLDQGLYPQPEWLGLTETVNDLIKNDTP